MARIRPRRLAGLLAIFVASYGVVLAAAWTSGTIRVAEQWLSDAACAGMVVFGNPDLRREVEVSLEGADVYYDYTLIRGTQTKTIRMKHPFHAHNIVLLMALVLVTPGLGARQRLLALVTGVGAIFLVDALIVIGDFVSVESKQFAFAGTDNVWLSLQVVGRVLRYSQPTGGAFMVPIFIWGLLLLGPFRARLMPWLRGEGPAERPKRRKGRRA